VKILILGVNGFIGHHLTEKLLIGGHEVYGMDLSSDRLDKFKNNQDFNFIEGDISINKEWIEYHIKKCDVVFPLVAIATPSLYVKEPLRVFELDFEENLEIIRMCVKYDKRLIFPSTSEVYGMSSDTEFHPETTNLVLGPISKSRWIYSASKQLLDRVIHAYGERGFNYTLFRPFNWFGPGLDNILEPREGASRVSTQFLGNIARGRDILLVDGGLQRRAFTYISDGIDALIKIVESAGTTNRKIYNIGNPNNDASILELANLMTGICRSTGAFGGNASNTRILSVSSTEYYGQGYQDVQSRVPYVDNLKEIGWSPRVSLNCGLTSLIEYYSATLCEADSLVSLESYT